MFINFVILMKEDMLNVLVTGGLGFIGSHICIELLQRGYNVYVIDNLENSTYDTSKKIIQICNLNGIHCENHFKTLIFDILDKTLLANFFEKENIDIVIHCAGKKSVNESITNPLDYYYSNITMTLHLLDMIQKHNIQTFIFSSSATVYGKHELNNYSNLNEESKTGENISNPYGKTKYIQEMIIRDFYINHKDLRCYLLRYFNPVGCHPSGIIGENPKDKPNNLMPYVLRVAANNNSISLFKEHIYDSLTIFGNNYDTKDGTCIRDFIHVCDLARAHIDVLAYINDLNNVETFNVGTGIGISVLELVKLFIKHNNINVTYVIGDKRDGDETITVCDNSKIIKLTNWKPLYDINDIVTHSWKYIVKNYIHGDDDS